MTRDWPSLPLCLGCLMFKHLNILVDGGLSLGLLVVGVESSSFLYRSGNEVNISGVDALIINYLRFCDLHVKLILVSRDLLKFIYILDVGCSSSYFLAFQSFTDDDR